MRTRFCAFLLGLTCPLLAGGAFAQAPCHHWEKPNEIREFQEQEIVPEGEWCYIDFKDQGNTYKAAMTWGAKSCLILNESSSRQPCVTFVSCRPWPVNERLHASSYNLKKLNKECSGVGDGKKKLSSLYELKSRGLDLYWSVVCKNKEAQRIELTGEAKDLASPVVRTCELPKMLGK